MIRKRRRVTLKTLVNRPSINCFGFQSWFEPCWKRSIQRRFDVKKSLSLIRRQVAWRSTAPSSQSGMPTSMLCLTHNAYFVYEPLWRMSSLRYEECLHRSMKDVFTEVWRMSSLRCEGVSLCYGEMDFLRRTHVGITSGAICLHLRFITYWNPVIP